jgi:ornithine cyclodeaminase/alanine dehydrogenase-like protein (mu-crystallin family)
MPALPFLDADAIRRALPLGDLLYGVEAANRDVAPGRYRSPLRSRVELPSGGDLLLMPGIREEGAAASVKLVSVVPANAERGLPTVQALVVLLDAVSGEPRALLDGEAITAMRTGAASGVATRLLARPGASVLAVLGAGGLAAWQIRAICAARPIREVRVFSRDPARRAAFVDRMADELAGVEVQAADSPELALRGAEVVACATASSRPVFDAEWVAAGAHVNGIGAFRLGMVELPARIFGRAALVTVDSRRAALAEAGDVVAAIEAGELSEDDLVEVGALPEGYAGRRDPGALTVFKSVGLAIQDVAAAELAARRLLDR